MTVKSTPFKVVHATPLCAAAHSGNAGTARLALDVKVIFL
jgi:hypothetical protein